jgi:radical SAM superfamily enzyme YgiQ (UPF0313 family)
MASTNDIKKQIRERLEAEKGTLYGEGHLRVALLYPSPYRAGMSSLGYQLIYRLINERPGTVAERAFLPDTPGDHRTSRTPLLTYESLSPVGGFDIVAISLAYELEVTGLLECFDLAGIPLYARDRKPHHPLIILGGPLTFSNPLPVGPFCDAIVMGEGEEIIPQLLDLYEGATSRTDFYQRAAAIPGVFVPVIHGERLIPTAAADNAKLPAVGQIRTPNTELANMHLVESERGCHRKCTFCVMRRSTNGGMRLASPDAIVGSIPEDATRVGLVGAAVSDHPKLVEIVGRIVGSGRELGLSSLRADRLTPELMTLLQQGGYRTLTVAADGCSERMRKILQKEIRESHLERAAHYAAEYKMRYLKLYLMIGAPGETREDIEELVAFSKDLSRICNVALGIAPFVAKRNTPLDRQPFAGIKPVEQILDYLQTSLRGHVDVRSTSARWAWVEYVMAQGGFDMADVAVEAWKNGGSFAAWKKAIQNHARSEQPDDTALRLGLPTGRFAGEVHPADFLP